MMRNRLIRLGKEVVTVIERQRQSIRPLLSGENVEDAIESLSQYFLAKRLFAILFPDYDYAGRNPMPHGAMPILQAMEEHVSSQDRASLTKFYTAIASAAATMTDAEKQTLIIDVFETLLKTAFPKLCKRLGVVFTPIEVVDFMLKSVDDALQREFGTNLSSAQVEITDPFTGTGVFITRLLQSSLIRPEDLERKYQSEIHAFEIVPMTCNVATANIEATYRDLTGVYEPFPGIRNIDTFQEYDEGEP